jgi:hypothetical protein
VTHIVSGFVGMAVNVQLKGKDVAGFAMRPVSSDVLADAQTLIDARGPPVRIFVQSLGTPQQTPWLIMCWHGVTVYLAQTRVIVTGPTFAARSFPMRSHTLVDDVDHALPPGAG